MRLTNLITLFLVLSLAFISLNCEDSTEPEAVIPEKYIGKWEANIEIVGSLIQYAPESDPGSGVDVRALGAAITATLNRDGTYTLTFVDPIEGTDTDAGTVILDEENNMITLNSNDDEDIIFAYEWDDDNTLILVTLSEFDFDLTGPLPAVPAIVTIILKRTG